MTTLTPAQPASEGIHIGRPPIATLIGGTLAALANTALLAACIAITGALLRARPS